MTTLHMDTEALEMTLRQIAKSSREIDQRLDRLKSHRAKIHVNWYGENASDAFYDRLGRSLVKLERHNESLQALHRKLRRELTEWLEVDARFDGGRHVGGGGFLPVQTKIDSAPVLTVAELQKRMCSGQQGDAYQRCLLIWGNPPTDAEELAYMIQSLPEDLPIVIMQIGENEFLVLMRGTTSGALDGSGWGSAFESMFGESSYQNSVVSALYQANLPANARLHFAGHSQGGMIGQNLAVDPRVLANYDVGSVSMFGSPDTYLMSNADVNYVSYEAPGDFIHKLDSVAAYLSEKLGINLDPANFQDVSQQAQQYSVTGSSEAYSLWPWTSHRVYHDDGVMSGYPVPFDATSWQPVCQEGTYISTLGPIIYAQLKGLLDPISVTTEAAQKAVDAVVGGLQNLGVI